MKILVANGFYAPEIGGGAEIVLHGLARGLIARGAEVAAFTTGETESVDVVDGVTVYRFPIDNAFRKLSYDLPGKLRRSIWQVRDLRSPLMARRFEQVLRAFRPDVVHFHNLSGLTRSIWPIPAKLGIPSVHVLHDLHLICPTSSMFKRGHSCRTRCLECRLFRTGFAEASRTISTVVGVSRFVLDRNLAEGLFEGCDQQVIYNALPSPTVSPLPGGEKCRFGYLGSLVPHKGVGWLIDQFDDSMGELLIAGTGPSAYTQQLRDKAAGKAITFLGYQNTQVFFASIDVGIVPSVWNDTLPGVAIEAGSHGRPVIASRRGGLPEIVREGESGLLVDPDQPDSLGQAMRTLAGDRAMVERMGRAAPQAVAQFTDFDRFLDEYETLHIKLK